MCSSLRRRSLLKAREEVLASWKTGHKFSVFYAGFLGSESVPSDVRFMRLYHSGFTIKF